MALRRTISNSLEQFIIFIGLYAHLVIEGGSSYVSNLVGLKKN